MIRAVKYSLLVFVAFMVLALFFVDGACMHEKTPYNVPAVTVKPGSVGVYVINLDRSTDRYDYVKTNIEKLGFPFERLSAVEGAKLSDEEIAQKVDTKTYLYLMGQSPRKGTIGCSLSHVKFWETFLASEYEYGVVFEDDVKFDPMKLRSAIDELIAVPGLWDINFFEMSHRGMPKTIKRLGEKQDMNLSVYLAKVTHTGSYIVNRNAAKILREHVFPIKMPIDHYIPRVWEFGLKFTGIEPRLVTQDYGDSEIMATTSVQKKRPPMISYVVRGVYTLKSEVMRFIYNLKQYFVLKQT